MIVQINDSTEDCSAKESTSLRRLELQCNYCTISTVHVLYIVEMNVRKHNINVYISIH